MQVFKSKPVTINGLSFPSIQAASIHLDIPETTLSYRLARGLSIETAEPRRDLRKERLARCKRGHAFTPENTRVYRSKDGFVCHICRACETIRKDRYLARQAALDPNCVKRPRPRPVTINGRTFPSITQAAAHFRVPVSTVHSRIARGQTMKEALTGRKD